MVEKEAPVAIILLINQATDPKITQDGCFLPVLHPFCLLNYEGSLP
jgi:hypothetical protein